MTNKFKKFLESYKHETVVLGPVKRMLLAKGSFDGRLDGPEVIHPSELAKPDFCPRAIFYRLKGWEIPDPNHGFQLEVIFGQGHETHEKWQNWLWDVGMLHGQFVCVACGTRFEAEAPQECPDEDCGAKRVALRYREVPARSEEHRIAGRADGDLGGPLLEIKSIGLGTVRYEAPRLLTKHTHKIEILDDNYRGKREKTWLDLDGLWKDIKRPFPSHIRQAMLYLFCVGRDEMVFVYEFKPTGAVREFTVTYDERVVEPMLDAALDILYAVEKDKVPDCPHDGCKLCQAYEDGAQDGPQTDDEDEEPLAGDGEGLDRGEGEAEEEGAEAPRQARSRDTRRPRRSRRHQRSRTDERVRPDHSLVRLLERTVDGGGDRRERDRAGVGEGTRTRDRKIIRRKRH